MKNKTKQRTKEVKVRLTEGELARLNDNVSLTGLSREQYLRLLIIHKTPTALPPADYRLLLRQMQWMETQLKELAGNQSTDENREQLDYTLQLLNSTVLLMGHEAGMPLWFQAAAVSVERQEGRYAGLWV